MKTQTLNEQQGLVKDLRKIRDQISNEIKDMTFEQERAYLDKLLADKEKSSHNIKRSRRKAQNEAPVRTTYRGFLFCSMLTEPGATIGCKVALLNWACQCTISTFALSLPDF